MLLATLLTLLASGAAVIAAGTVLARSGDVIAARTGLGGVWIGSIFLAIATSLPELTTDIAAVWMGSPDLALGDLFGSSMSNMLILAVVSLVPGAELFRKAALENALLIALAMIMTSIAAIALLMRSDVAWLNVGIAPAVLVLVYVFGVRLIFQRTSLARELGTTEETAAPEEGEEPRARPMTLRRAVLRFALAAGVILVAAPFFASSARRIAELTGIDASFVGTLLLGFSTSLPELVTALAAVRMAAYDLAVANLYGSCACNMVVLFVLDAVHGATPIVAAVDPVHAISALVALVLMGIGLAAVVSRTQRSRSLTQPSGAMMVVGYLLGLGLVWLRAGA